MSFSPQLDSAAPRRARLIPLALLLCLLLAPARLHAVSVRDFGAVGDGKADDTAAIQRAIDAGQGPVDLPYGRYRLTASLRLGSNTGLIGPGILAMENDLTTLVNEPGPTSHTNITLSGFRIEKKFVENSEQDGLRLRGVDGLRVEGLDITGMSACIGIHLVSCRNFSIRDCHIHDFFTSWTERRMPSGKFFDALGIRLTECAFGDVIGNRIENLLVSDESADAMAWQTDGINPALSRQVTIANNVIRNVGEGIDLVGCHSFSLTGNVIEDCWHFGIKVIHGTRFTTITGNTIRNAALAGMSLYFGNPELGDGYGNVVMGNTIANAGALRRENDGTAKGIWKGWPYCGIEIVNDNRATNDVRDYVIANNVIIDDQSSPTCQYGIIERYITFESEEKAIFEERPVDDGELFRNLISGNLIRGMKIAAYRTGSNVD